MGQRRVTRILEDDKEISLSELSTGQLFRLSRRLTAEEDVPEGDFNRIFICTGYGGGSHQFPIAHTVDFERRAFWLRCRSPFEIERVMVVPLSLVIRTEPETEED